MKQKGTLKELLISLIILITLISSIVWLSRNKVSFAAANVNDFNTFKTADASSLLGARLHTGNATEDMTYRILRAKGQYGCLSHKDSESQIDTDKNYVNSVYDVVFIKDPEDNDIRKLAIKSVGRGMSPKTAYAGKDKEGKAAINLALAMATEGNMNGVYQELRKANSLGIVVDDPAISNGDDDGIVAGRRNNRGR